MIDPRAVGIAALILAGVASQAAAQPAPQARQAPAQQPAHAERAATPSALYDRLKAAGSAEEAEALVRQIARRWGRSGSDTSDLLMSRARQALGHNNPDIAVELLDRLLVLQPGWAEAWHVRGMAFFVMQDDARALADFREALRREPRHFMALGMTAAALQRQGQEKAALAAYRAVREMHPYFQGLKEAIERLLPNVDGRDA